MKNTNQIWNDPIRKSNLKLTNSLDLLQKINADLSFLKKTFVNFVSTYYLILITQLHRDLWCVYPWKCAIETHTQQPQQQPQPLSIWQPTIVGYWTPNLSLIYFTHIHPKKRNTVVEFFVLTGKTVTSSVFFRLNN